MNINCVPIHVATKENGPLSQAHEGRREMKGIMYLYQVKLSLATSITQAEDVIGIALQYVGNHNKNIYKTAAP